MAIILREYPSSSKPGKMYHLIEAKDGTIYCDCWQWRKNKTCKHLMHYMSNQQGVTCPAAVRDATPVEDEFSADVRRAINNIINA